MKTLVYRFMFKAGLWTVFYPISSISVKPYSRFSCLFSHEFFIFCFKHRNLKKTWCFTSYHWHVSVLIKWCLIKLCAYLNYDSRLIFLTGIDRVVFRCLCTILCIIEIFRRYCTMKIEMTLLCFDWWKHAIVLVKWYVRENIYNC